jgi:NAD(P)H dehydrogenase (quinone)
MSIAKPIKHALIACHPSAESFTMSIAARYAETARSLKHDVLVRDLYRMGFDPILKNEERPAPYKHHVSGDVAEELATLAGTDVFVLVYPMWFATPPAMMKGYLERVWGSDFSYEKIRDRRPHPLLTGKLLVSLSTSGTSSTWLHEQGVLLSLRNIFDNYLKHAFTLEDALHYHFDRIPEGMAPNFGDQILSEVEDRTREICSRFGYGLTARRSEEI